MIAAGSRDGDFYVKETLKKDKKSLKALQKLGSELLNDLL